MSEPTLPDLVPLPQDDGPFPVVAIDYDPDGMPTALSFVSLPVVCNALIFDRVFAARVAFDLLRAVMAAKEVSARALQITESAISHNPASYVAWYGVCSVNCSTFALYIESSTKVEGPPSVFVI